MVIIVVEEVVFPANQGFIDTESEIVIGAGVFVGNLDFLDPDVALVLGHSSHSGAWRRGIVRVVIPAGLVEWYPLLQ